MAQRRTEATWSLLARAGLAAAVLLPAVALLARQYALLVQQCVPGQGAAGWLGLRLALLRADAVCPDGTLAVGGDGGRVLGVVAVVALPVLVAHLAGLSLGIGLLARLRRLAHGVVAVLAAALPHLPDDVESPATVLRLTTSVARAFVVLRRAAEAPWRRGPPALLPA